MILQGTNMIKISTGRAHHKYGKNKKIHISDIKQISSFLIILHRK